MTRPNSASVLRRTSERLTAGAAAIAVTFLMLLTVEVRAAEADANPPRITRDVLRTPAFATERRHRERVSQAQDARPARSAGSNPGNALTLERAHHGPGMCRRGAGRRRAAHQSPDADVGARGFRSRPGLMFPGKIVGRARSAVQQEVCSLFFPSRFVSRGQTIEIRRCRRRIVDPLAQQFAAVDEVDGETRVLVLVGKIAPQRVFAAQAPDALERAGDQAPGPELAVLIRAVFDVDLEPRAQLAGVFLERRLEPAGPQPAAARSRPA